MTVRIGSLFTGVGGLDMAVAAHYGGQVVWHCENDRSASAVLAHHYPDVPNLGDITAVDWTGVAAVDVLCGGFPCQDLSHAGKRHGLRDGTRSGLWSAYATAIETLQPKVVIVENVRGILSAKAPGLMEPCEGCVGDVAEINLRALGRVLADLSDLGFDAVWGTVRASDAGACHRRERVFIVATSYAGRGQLARPAESSDGLSIATERSLHPDLTLLPTPAARDHKGPNPNQRTGGVDLPTAVADYGPYTAAISRWEQVVDRPAPSPTEPNKDWPRLSPRFVEWMMGLPDGWVTDAGISRTAQLKTLGNGVVPQQALIALRLLDGGAA